MYPQKRNDSFMQIRTHLEQQNRDRNTDKWPNSDHCSLLTIVCVCFCPLIVSVHLNFLSCDQNSRIHGTKLARVYRPLIDLREKN